LVYAEGVWGQRTCLGAKKDSWSDTQDPGKEKKDNSSIPGGEGGLRKEKKGFLVSRLKNVGKNSRVIMKARS